MRSFSREDVMIGVSKLDALMFKLNTDKDAIIEQLIKDEFGYSFSDLAKPNKSGKFSKPRQLAIYLMYRQGKSSPLDIAAKFKRSKSTCLYAVSEVYNKIETDIWYRKMVKNMEDIINESNNN